MMGSVLLTAIEERDLGILSERSMRTWIGSTQKCKSSDRVVKKGIKNKIISSLVTLYKCFIFHMHLK